MGEQNEEALTAAALGLDLATFRLLRELERRDINPEDYELLGRLDEPIKPATLRPEQLQRFPTETYAVACADVSDDVIGRGSDSTSCGSSASGDLPWSGDLCVICCVELLQGDAFRTLRPCGHRFHKHCIDKWLLESSSRCPVDQQEVQV